MKAAPPPQMPFPLSKYFTLMFVSQTKLIFKSPMLQLLIVLYINLGGVSSKFCIKPSCCLRDGGAGSVSVTWRQKRQPFTPRGNLGVQINRTCVFGLWEETHMCLARTCKLHPGRCQAGVKPVTFTLWGGSSNHCSAMSLKALFKCGTAQKVAVCLAAQC